MKTLLLSFAFFTLLAGEVNAQATRTYDLCRIRCDRTTKVYRLRLNVSKAIRQSYQVKDAPGLSCFGSTSWIPLGTKLKQTIFLPDNVRIINENASEFIRDEKWNYQLLNTAHESLEYHVDEFGKKSSRICSRVSDVYKNEKPVSTDLYNKIPLALERDVFSGNDSVYSCSLSGSVNNNNGTHDQILLKKDQDFASDEMTIPSLEVTIVDSLGNRISIGSPDFSYRFKNPEGSIAHQRLLEYARPFCSTVL